MSRKPLDPLDVPLVEGPNYQTFNVDTCYGDSFDHKVMLTFGEFLSHRSRGDYIMQLKVQLTMNPGFLVILRNQLNKQIEAYEQETGVKLTNEGT